MQKQFNLLLCTLLVLTILSCATKKDIIYLQDANALDTSKVALTSITLQPDDILKITVGSLVPEAALPYNKPVSAGVNGNSIEVMKLEGYVVSKAQTIDFPVLGTISVNNRSAEQLAAYIKAELEANGHLKEAFVNVRLLNGKFTVLGEVNNPGTFNFTDTNLTLFQALGLAGDLTITGQRDDVRLIREIDGNRKVTHIDLTTTDWITSDLYHIKPNDVIIVNANTKRVKSSGLIGDTSTFLGVASLLISISILLTR